MGVTSSRRLLIGMLGWGTIVLWGAGAPLADDLGAAAQMPINVPASATLSTIPSGEDPEYSLGETTWSGPLVGDEEVAPAPSDPYRSEVERAWFGAGVGLAARAAAVRRPALSLGIDNFDSAARALIGSGDPGNELSNAMLAVRLAPDLPVAHMALARQHWAEGSRGDAFNEVVSAVMSMPRNLEASVWVVGSLLTMLALVLVLGPLMFIASVGVGFFGRGAHDLGDLSPVALPGFARFALLCILLLVPLLLGEGIAGLTLVLFSIGMVYGGSRHRMALVLAATLFVLGLYPVSQLASTVLRGLDADPIAAAALAVAQGTETRPDLERLEAAAGSDFVAAHALAVHARRAGDTEDAVRLYSELQAAYPREAVVLGNYANIQFGLGDNETAAVLYERSAALLDSAVIMFNLSQAYARMFKIEEFEGAMRVAQGMDGSLVADLSRVGDANFVADIPFPMGQLRSRFFESARHIAAPADGIELLLPGWLGSGWLQIAGAFALMAMISVFLSGRFDQASACSRCGKRICARCDGTVWNSETCDGCHHLFHRPETTDPVKRMARLQELQKRESLRERIAALSAILIPGSGGLLARRPDLGFIGVLLFGSACALFVFRDGVVADPLTVGAAGPPVFVITGCFAAFGYLVVVVLGLLLRRNS